MDATHQLLLQIIDRLTRVEELVRSQKAVKDHYTTAEFGKKVDRDEYTVREWCRMGRLHAEKTSTGRGNRPEWRISHEELVRYQREGLLPFRRFS